MAGKRIKDPLTQAETLTAGKQTHTIIINNNVIACAIICLCLLHTQFDVMCLMMSTRVVGHVLLLFSITP